MIIHDDINVNLDIVLRPKYGQVRMPEFIRFCRPGYVFYALKGADSF
jgi:hypothetical protein